MVIREHLKKYRIELCLGVGALALMMIFAFMERITLHAEDGSLLSGHSTMPVYTELIGVPLDDVYIHCRFAQNLLNGRSFGFNPNTRVSADTSPLWVVLLAVFGGLGMPLDAASVALSAFFFILMPIGIYRTCRDLLDCGEYLSIVAGILGILSSRIAWSAMSGMEVTLALLLVLLVVEEHIRSVKRKRMRVREGVLLGLAVGTRPECQLLVLLVVADWLWLKFRDREFDVGQFVPAVIAMLVIAAPVWLFPFLTRSSPISHSSVVQGATIHLLPSFEFLLFVLKMLVTNNVLLLVLLVIGIGLIRDKRLRLAVLFCFSLPLLQAWIAPQMRHHGRYLFPIFPVAILIAAEVIRLGDWQRAGWCKVATYCLLGLGMVETGRWIMIEAGSVRNINDQHLAAVAWIKTLPAQGVLAVDDVGAIGYFTDRTVFDLTGLVSPEAFPLQHDQDSVWMLARSKGANVFLIYNRLNVPFYEHHKDSLSLLRTFRVRLPLMSSADTVMSVYQVREAAVWH